MYSYEDRIRAVTLYIKLGKRTVATIRQLGYPTKNALKGWHRKYEQGHDLQVGYGRLWQKYSDEQKQAAVAHYLSHDRCIAGIIKALGYPCRDTFRAWIEELHPEVRNHVFGKAAGVPHSPERKQAAVIALCTRQISAQAIAQKLAVSRPTLYQWKNQLLGRKADASMKPPNDSGSGPDETQLTDLQQQVDLLQRISGACSSNMTY